MDDVNTGAIANSVHSSTPDNGLDGQPGPTTKRNPAICRSLKLDDILLRKLTAAGWTVSGAGIQVGSELPCSAD